MNVEDFFNRQLIMLSQHLLASLVKMCYVLDCSMPADRFIVARATTLLASKPVSIQLTSVTCDKLFVLISSNVTEIISVANHYMKNFIFGAALTMWIPCKVSTG